MFDAQKLMQRLEKMRVHCLAGALEPVPPNLDVKYEFGRRIGYKEGLDDAIRNVLKFFKDDEHEEKDSKL